MIKILKGINSKIINTMLFFIILFCGIIFKLNSFNFSFDMSFCLCSLFILIIYKLWGFKRALGSAVLIYVLAIFKYSGNIYDIFLICEVIFIHLLDLYKPNISLIYKDILFWILVGIPIKVIFYSNFEPGTSTGFIWFNTIKDSGNAIVNAVIADIIVTYMPLLKIRKGNCKRYYVKFKDLIFHILIVSILAPFIFIFFINSWSSYEKMMDSTNDIAKNIVTSIEDKLKSWSEKEKNMLLLNGIVQKEYLNQIISREDSLGFYKITITNLDNEIIASNDELYSGKSKLKWEEVVAGSHKESLNFYYDEENYISKYKIIENRANVYLSIPISEYKEKTYEYNLQLFRTVIIFSLIIIVGVVFINKLIFKSIGELALVTTGAPESIGNVEGIGWPSSCVSEISALIENFKDMLYKLQEKFEESDKLNKRLETQTRQLLSSKKKLHKQAYYDTLTGLPNRLNFLEQLEGLSNLYSGSERFCIIYFDVNHFKEINDTLGHDMGDKLLYNIAKRLEKIISDKTLIYRLGGDEFVVVSRIFINDDIENLGASLIKLLNREFIIDDKRLDVTISLGASVYPDHSYDISSIIKYADIAMYKSKENGGSYLEIFNEEMKNEFISKYNIEKEIARAIENSEFELYYQPKIKLSNNRVTSFEALIRWNNHELGNVSPGVFIPIAEETELIISIDKWVIDEACRYISKLNNSGYKDIQVSINISPKHFTHLSLVDEISSAIEKYNIRPYQIKIEITEGIMISNLDEAINIIIKLNELGVKISIDDFGRGFSSFSQLINLPIDEIKIDREFVTMVDRSDKKSLVVSLIVDLAHRLNLNIVAEGIERVEEKDFLIKVGCDELQGFLYSKPLPEEKVLEYLMTKVGK